MYKSSAITYRSSKGKLWKRAQKNRRSFHNSSLWLDLQIWQNLVRQQTACWYNHMACTSQYGTGYLTNKDDDTAPLDRNATTLLWALRNVMELPWNTSSSSRAFEAVWECSLLLQCFWGSCRIVETAVYRIFFWDSSNTFTSGFWTVFWTVNPIVFFPVSLRWYSPVSLLLKAFQMLLVTGSFVGI